MTTLLQFVGARGRPAAIAMVALIVIVFLVDIRLPLGFAAGSAYVLPMVFGLWVRGRRAVVAAALAGCALTFLALALKPPGGTPVAVAVNRGIGLLLIAAAATAVLREQRLRQRSDEIKRAHRMEAVGRIARGVAHDFNNLLTSIRCFTELARDTIPEGKQARDDLSEVLSATDLAVTFTRRLSACSGHAMVDPQPVELGAIVASMEPLLKGMLGDAIEIVTRQDDDPWHSLIDAGAFEQVLLNLALNARDAMPDGGRLIIETTKRRLDRPETLRVGGTIAAGEYAVLVVIDRGIGMDETVRERMFDPFFTTKGPGKGTGLGLWLVHGIVDEAHGAIDVVSAPGSGTSFSIFLPRLRPEPMSDEADLDGLSALAAARLDELPSYPLTAHIRILRPSRNTLPVTTAFPPYVPA